MTSTAPETPSRIVAYVSPAAALRDVDIRPIGMCGQTQGEAGELAGFLTERGLDQATLVIQAAQPLPSQ